MTKRQTPYTDYFYSEALRGIQFLDELGGPSSREYIDVMTRLAEECKRRAEVCRETHYDAAAFWQARGFERICTGGNCYAWERTIKRGGFHPIQILITSNDDQETHLVNDVHNVGLYLYGQGEHYAFDYFPNAVAAWDWIREQLAMPEES